MKRFVAVSGAAVVAAAVVLLLSWTYFFEQLNFIGYDFTMRLAGPVTPASPITIVAIDDESLERLGPWPWRTKLAKIIDVVGRGKPRVLAVDIILDEAEKEETDAEIARAIGGAGSVVLAARISTKAGVDRWLRPLPLFLQPNVRLGHVHADPDLDTINRRILPAKQAEGTILPAFSIETLRAAKVQIDPAFESALPGATIYHPKAVGIRFTGEASTFPQIPAWKVYEDQAPTDAFRDRIVLIGWTAETFDNDRDRWFTPFSQGLQMSGVVIHANAIDTLFGRRWIEEAPPDIVFIALVGAILLLWWMDRRFEGYRFYAAAILMGPAMVAVSWLLMKYWSIWFPFPPFLITIVLVLPALEVLKVVRVNRDLDSKIEGLSRWGKDAAFVEWNPSEHVAQKLARGPQREAWLAAIQFFEAETSRRQSARKRLLGTRWKNSKWRLGAVDFFNEELVQFLSFNTAILGSIDDVTVVSDVEGRVVYQNPAARRLDAFSANAPFAPDYFAALLDGRDFASVFAEVISSQKTVTMPFVPARGGQKVFNVTLAPIGRTGLVLSLHDATAQFELNVAKNEMVSLVSHELRTPLTAIRGYSDMLLKYNLVQEKGKEFLGTILEESDRLNNLIQSFLDIAYIESGRQKVSKTDFAVGPMLRDMMSVLSPVALAKSIRLESPEETGTRVCADRLLLYQALTNLVTNAIKYSPAGTTVRMAVLNGNGRVRFQVSDQGCGIPMDEANKIFDKFYRRANKETQEQTGFGLGLAFVKEVAVRHGGEVTVESQVGRGSTFTLQIPV